jgi:hypothetical protein
MDEMVGIDYEVHHEGLISAVYHLGNNSCIAQAAHHMVSRLSKEKYVK